MIQTPNKVQLDFFEKIKQRIPENESFPERIAEVLGLSADSTYRRIRGVTSLTLEEMVTLCNHFKVSFDLGAANVGETGLVTFHYRTISDNESRMLEYLQDLNRHLKYISQFKNKLVIYAAEDVPVFHHFKFAKLTAFKVFYWKKSLLDEELLSNAVFEFGKVDAELIKIARENYELYSRIPTIEIWTEATLDSTVKQLEYYYDSGIITREQARVICGEVLEMLANIEEMAVKSRKDKDGYGEYKMYYSDVMIGTNAVLARLEDTITAFLSFDGFNNLTTTDAELCKEVNKWMEILIKKSSLVSGINEKQRIMIFKKIKNKAEMLMNHILQSE